MKQFIISLILLSSIHSTSSTGMSAKSSKSAKSGKSSKSGKSAKSYQTTTSTIYTNTVSTTSECCETHNQIDNYSSSLTTTTLASTSYQNVITNLFSLPTVTIPSSSTITYTTSSLETIDEQNNSSVLGINDNNSSQKISAALISVISLSIFIISTIFTITLLRRKKQTRDDSILENQNYVGNTSYEEPVPIIEQVIDSYYGNVEEGIIYENENAEDEEGYLYALPQSDCDQTIFDESYESVSINQNQNQGKEQIISDNLYEKASQEDVLYDLGNNNYIYNEFC